MNTVDKLNKIEGILDSKEFRESLGAANEVSYYIFDYDPKDELLVREYVSNLMNKVNNQVIKNYKIQKFDLYDILIEYLKDSEILEEVFEIEEESGYQEIINALSDALELYDPKTDYFVNYVKDRLEDNTVVFITGVGKIYPIVRSHDILKKMHLVIENVPVIVFIPGEYNGMEIKLFGKLNSNYYRAFKLIG